MLRIVCFALLASLVSAAIPFKDCGELYKIIKSNSSSFKIEIFRKVYLKCRSQRSQIG